MDHKLMNKYTEILKEELIVAKGCTEPIAIAYAASNAAHLLGEKITKIDVFASGNVIKNAKGVIVPNTKDLRGVRSSAILGALFGDYTKCLEVLNVLSNEDIELTKTLRQTDFCTYYLKQTSAKLYIEVIVYSESNKASCTIKHTHTNITELTKNDHVLYQNECDDSDFNTPLSDRLCLNIKDIYHYTNEIDLDLVRQILDNQIDLNLEIALEGLSNNYGLSVGKIILEYSDKSDYIAYAKALTASGSDARMSGCSLPVMTNSGSGNQGMTVSLPVIAYWKHMNLEYDMLLRALVLSNLIAIHIKTNLGRLSAFCGAVVAAVGSASGIVFLMDGNLTQIEYTIKNMLANISGIFCDGAKPSCALKIATCIDAAFMSAFLALKDKVVEDNTGIVCSNIEDFIKNIGDIGCNAMNETDKKILDIMTQMH